MYLRHVQNKNYLPLLVIDHFRISINDEPFTGATFPAHYPAKFLKDFFVQMDPKFDQAIWTFERGVDGEVKDERHWYDDETYEHKSEPVILEAYNDAMLTFKVRLGSNLKIV